MKDTPLGLLKEVVDHAAATGGPTNGAGLRAYEAAQVMLSEADEAGALAMLKYVADFSENGVKAHRFPRRSEECEADYQRIRALLQVMGARDREGVAPWK